MGFCELCSEEIQNRAEYCLVDTETEKKLDICDEDGGKLIEDSTTDGKCTYCGEFARYQIADIDWNDDTISSSGRQEVLGNLVLCEDCKNSW
ncbi:hypothetical protein [Halorussus ruber]|uniref:hypothetical protein n=1 Tax=Halorussus ruber TaxID=1126238 RepID=UPI001092D081|nr:hypothetical protein [Halorussus ruber]